MPHRSGSRKSDLYPTIIAATSGTAYLNPELFYQTFAVQDLNIFDAHVHLAYTLVDFGARRTEISAAQARLVAANLSFNNEHLDLSGKSAKPISTCSRQEDCGKRQRFRSRTPGLHRPRRKNDEKTGLLPCRKCWRLRLRRQKQPMTCRVRSGLSRSKVEILPGLLPQDPVKPLQVEPLDQLRIPDKLDQSVEEAINTAFKDRPNLEADQARVRAAQAEVKRAYLLLSVR